MLDNNVAPGEPITHRDIAYLTNSIDNLTSIINQLRVEMAQTYVRKDVNDGDLAAIRDDITRHDDWLTWAQRIVIGLVLVGLVTLLITQGSKG
jgi:hypothetical protein